MNHIQDQAQAIYEKGGQVAVLDAVNDGTLKATLWGYCSGCEDYSPADEKRDCLCCGLTVFGEVL